MRKKQAPPDAMCHNRYSRWYCLLCTVLLSAGSFLPVTGSAQNIGNWTFNGLLTGVPGLFNTVAIADFSTGVPIHSFNGGSEYYGENGWPAGSINTAMYLQFTLVPLPGYQLDVNSIVLTLRRSNTGSPAGSGPTAWSLRSSLDGFATDIASGSMTYTYANYTATMGSSFLNLYTAITFRLYGYNAAVNPGGNSRLVVDNITVKGLGYLLPVQLGAFNAGITNQHASISYTVYNTQKADRYIIERSADGNSYEAVSMVTETANASAQHYTITDDLSALSSPQFYYRLKLVSQTGPPVYSASILVKRTTAQPTVKLFMSNGYLHLDGTFAAGGHYQAIMYTAGGQVITHSDFVVTAGYNTIALPVNRKLVAPCLVRVCNSRGYNSSAWLVGQ